MIQGQAHIYRKIVAKLKAMAAWLERYPDPSSCLLRRKLLELAEDFEIDLEVMDYE